MARLDLHSFELVLIMSEPPEKCLKGAELTDEEAKEQELVRGLVQQEVETSMTLDKAQIVAVCCHYGFPDNLSAVELSDALIRKDRGEPFIRTETLSCLFLWNIV